MRMMTKAAFVVATMAIASAANATPVPAFDEDYQGIYNINNAYPSHGLWLPNLTTGLGGATEWSVTGGEAKYVGNTMTIDGSAANSTASNLSLDFNFLLTEITNHPNAPECGNGNACNSTAAADVAAREKIKFFDLTSATLTGTAGTDLEGLKINLSIKPGNGAKPPQFGYGGNWLNMEFGYSNWFYYTVEKQATNANYAVTPNQNGGDINLTFTGSDNNIPDPVPLPAGLPLLLGALGVMGFVSRRRRA